MPLFPSIVSSRFLIVFMADFNLLFLQNSCFILQLFRAGLMLTKTGWFHFHAVTFIHFYSFLYIFFLSQFLMHQWLQWIYFLHLCRIQFSLHLLQISNLLWHSLDPFLTTYSLSPSGGQVSSKYTLLARDVVTYLDYTIPPFSGKDYVPFSQIMLLLILLW